MALNPNLLQSLPDNLVNMYGLVEIDILEDMARRISTYDYFIPAALHQNQKLQALGLTQAEIIAKLSAMTGQTQEELVALLSEASAEAVDDDIEYYSRAEVYAPEKVDTEALYSQLNSGLIQTQQAFFNITGTTANTATKQFERALDRAWLQINTGGMDYQTAIRRAITELAEAGLGAIEYPSGRIDSIEVAVRRAVVTGANQTAMKTQEVLADELEIDLVEVTAHGGARPEHAKWQGKVFSRKGRVTIDGITYEDFAKATGYGTGAGLGGWNCRHNFHPYVPGTSRTWNDEALKKLEEKSFEYNGEKYTEYEASQIQRGIEREIRKQKRIAAALDAAGEDSSAVRAKLKEAQKSYTDFTEQTGLKKQSARTQIATAKAKRAVNKTNKVAAQKTVTPSQKGVSPSQAPPSQNSTSKPLTKSGKNDTISSIETPIERRDAVEGNPSAIVHFGVNLNKRQQKLLKSLPEYDSRVVVPKKSVSMKDLAALTAKTNVEYAMFTKGAERLIIRGNSSKVNIDSKDALELIRAGYKWSGHTHPSTGRNSLQASAGDYSILKLFKQSSSVIYNALGEYLVFWG